jgi:exodeoxyribonuclease VII small subunit
MAGKKKETEKPSTFEEAVHRLEEIVDQLESGDVALDRAMTLYEEGVELSKFCTAKLAQAERVLKKLTKDADGKFSLEDAEE